MTGARVDTPALATVADSEGTYVVFTVDAVRYALPVTDVQRTLPYPLVTRLPVTPRHTLGAFQHGGRVVALWDLHVLFETVSDPPESPWVVLTERLGKLLALAVGHVDDVVTVPAAVLQPADTVPAAARPAVQGVLAPAPQETATAPSDEASTGPDATIAAARPERGAQQLQTLHPVHLLDLAKLRKLGGEEAAA